jgi:Ca2+/Na+ antiporter
VTILLFILGLVALVAGAELLVRGASRLATTMGISPLEVGLTVVAFGTSSPELMVSLKAALAGALQRFKAEIGRPPPRLILPSSRRPRFASPPQT